jgi:hypothetical protein
LGTIVLHWTLVVALVVSTLTGLRISSNGKGATLARSIEAWLPAHNVWFLHIVAGVSVMVVAAAYPTYLSRTGLARRVRLDWSRVRGLWMAGSARWRGLNVLLYWLLFIVLAALLISGLALHRGFGGWLVVFHRSLMWVVVGYTICHILTHVAFGGLGQLMRVFRPSPIPATAQSIPRDEDDDDSPPARSVPLVSRRANIVAWTGLAGLAVAIGFFWVDHVSRDTLHIQRVSKSAAPRVSEGLSDAAWRTATPLLIRTQQGANLDGSGESTVEIRAVYDGDTAYFAFTWEDSTHSLKNFPLLKAIDGWHRLTDETQLSKFGLMPPAPEKEAHENSNFEDSYVEDRFAIMLSKTEKPFGPGAFHMGPKPLEDKPPSSSGRGLHYTTDGSSVDVWVWHAASGSDTAQCDYDRIGAPAAPSADQLIGRTAYKGGYLSDPAQTTVTDNFVRTDPIAHPDQVIPIRLPKDLPTTLAAMGRIDLDADHGESDGARWFLTADESIPYSSAADMQIPIGTIIPGVLSSTIRVAPESLRCVARWAAGRWTLITARPLAASGDHVPIADGTFMWVAVFDHTSARHTRHIRPIRLELK